MVQANEARICHIANAGFYVTDGEKGVLLDADDIAETRHGFSPKTVVPMHIVKENFDDWPVARDRILASFPDTLEMFGEMDCHPII